MRLIDADKLKKDVLDLQDCYNGFSDTYDKACIIGVIDEQPTADVRENVHGEWIDDYDPVNFGEFRYKCSRCGARTVEWADNFCYKCGADMRGEEDD